MKKIICVFLVCLLIGCSNSGQQEDLPVENNHPAVDDSVSDQLMPQGKTRGEWIEYIQESGVFHEYCSNVELITYDEMKNSYEIKAQPKDVPTIAVSQNSDGTFTAVRNYIITKSFTYEKNNEMRRAELTVTVLLNQGKEDFVTCLLYVPDSDVNNYHFYYEPDLKVIYQNGKSDVMKFANDLQTKIVDYCQQVMEEIETLEPKVYGLMETILNEKGFKDIVWKDVHHMDTFLLNDIDEIYPLIVESYENSVYSVLPGYYVIKMDDLYGVVDSKRNVLLDCVSTIMPFANDYTTEFHLHYHPFIELAVQKKSTDDSPFKMCPMGHGGNNFIYVADMETNDLKKIKLSDDGPGIPESIDLSFMNDDAGIYEQAKAYKMDHGMDDSYVTTGKFGVFNRQGVVGSALYSDAFPTIGKLVPVADEANLWGYVDANGNEVIPCEYEASLPLYRGEKAWPVINDCVILKDGQTGKYGVKDTAGTTIVEFDYDFIGWIDEHQMVGRVDNVWYLYTSEGWVVNDE